MNLGEQRGVREGRVARERKSAKKVVDKSRAQLLVIRELVEHFDPQNSALNQSLLYSLLLKISTTTKILKYRFDELCDKIIQTAVTNMTKQRKLQKTFDYVSQ